MAPGATVRVSFWTLAAGSRGALLDSIDKRRDANAYTRASMLAWTQAQAQLYHLGVTAGEASLFQRLAGHVIYAAPALRPASETILRGVGAQSGLWPQGVSGDLPIVLVRISDAENLGVVRELLQAHEYWLRKQLAVDLVILNERQASYIQELQISIESMVRVSQARLRPDAASSNGRVFALRADLISGESWRLLKSVARVVLSAQRGSLAEQIERIVEPRRGPCARRGSKRCEPDGGRAAARAARSGVLQRPRRFRQERNGIRDGSRTRPVDSGALDQRHRQSGLWFSDRHGRRRLYVVGQQPREPD